MKLAEAAQLLRYGMDPYGGTGGKKLFLTVVGIHVVMIPFLCLLTWFDEERLKREEVPPLTKEVVIPIVMNLPAENPQQKTDAPPAGNPQPPKPKEKDFDLGALPPIEPLPELPPPPPKPKPQVKPQTKPKPKPQVKPKPAEVKPKPKPQQSIADRIRAQREKNKNKTVTRPRETEADRRERAAREAAERAAQERAKALSNFRQGLQGVDNSGVEGILADSKDREYLDKLKTFMEGRFRPPSDAQLNGRKPETVVSVSIASDGRILDWKIIRSSGYAAMDDAVRNTMRNLKTVLVPPHAMKVPFTFRAK